MNKNIANTIRKLWIILAAFILGQILLTIIVNALVTRYAVNFGFDATTESYIKKAATALVILGAIIQNVVFLRRIFKTKSLLNTQPIRCVVEDFIINRYRKDNKLAYRVYLLLKDPVSNELYFTYGPHSLSFYTSVFSRSGHNLTEAKVFRKDGTEVRLGDVVWMYIRKKIQVSVNTEKEHMRLNGEKFAYKNVNTDINSDTFKNVQFFEGAVDVDPCN